MPTPAPRTVAPHERQLSLLVRLQDVERPLTGDELFASVDGYREQLGTAKRSALEKQLERDRAALAELGVDVITVPDPVAPGDRARWRYALAPADDGGRAVVELTALETVLVDRATNVWLAPEVAAPARRGYLKLLGAGDPQADPAAGLPSARLTTDPAFVPLQTAIAERRRVEFDYVNAGAEAPLRRRVVPLRLVVVDGRWLCNCFDLERDAERNFLVARIVGEVADAGPRDDDGLVARTDLPAALAELAARNPADIAVRPESDAATRLGRRAAAELPPLDVDGERWPVVRVPSWDHELLADELAGLGAQVRALAPATLAAAVRRRLERMLAEHDDGGAA
ncbi:MAG: WYL domain-containing protein [Microbacteriaceae bacterium]|nr:WYL domain-containing protein [Microbacteriaceae bacterium]